MMDVYPAEQRHFGTRAPGNVTDSRGCAKERKKSQMLFRLDVAELAQTNLLLISRQRDEVLVRPPQLDDWNVPVDRSSPKTEHLGQAPIILRFTADDADREDAAYVGSAV